MVWLVLAPWVEWIWGANFQIQIADSLRKHDSAGPFCLHSTLCFAKYLLLHVFLLKYKSLTAHWSCLSQPKVGDILKQQS